MFDSPLKMITNTLTGTLQGYQETRLSPTIIIDDGMPSDVAVDMPTVELGRKFGKKDDGIVIPTPPRLLDIIA